jgi:hypothetical protein
MATLVNRHMFWVHHGQVTPCVVVAHDLTTARCDIVAARQRYTVDAYALYREADEAARAAAAHERTAVGTARPRSHLPLHEEA